MYPVKELMPLNEASVAVINELSRRKRHRNRSDLRQMFSKLEEKNKDLKMDDFLFVFKMLEELGFGSIVEGRGVKPTRFVWSYNLKDVSKVIQGEKELRDLKQLSIPSKKPKVVKRIQKNEVLEPKINQDIKVYVLDKSKNIMNIYTIDENNRQFFLDVMHDCGSLVK